ncbi:MAG: baseplate J/gp47 family protein, partial [Bacteroidota bacterium]
AYNVLFQIIQTAPTHFQQSLQRNDHRPHITLFLAFLELFQLIQNDLNQLPRRHLDFYYKEVLQLKTKAAIADKVHLFFELAKNIEEHELKKAVRFKAGKDSEGNDLFYTLDQDGVFNKAQVVDIKTISKQNANQLHAAPIANSVDGKGGKFSKTETNPAWMTLGGEATPKASIGFAIASRELLLAEGERTVTITLNEDGFEFPSSKNNLTVELSGEKDWIPVTLSTDATLASNVLKFTLDAAVPPVVPFDAKKLKMELGTTLPVLRILLPEETDYEAWKEQTIEKIELTVDVSGVTNILAFNDLGPIDPSNSFLPFGPVPKKGSSLYIGSKEAFQKSLTSVTLNLEWEGLPDFSIYYRGYDTPFSSLNNNETANNLADDYFDIIGQAAFTFKSKVLKSKSDIDLSSNVKELFNSIIPLNSEDLAEAILQSELETYGVTSDYGFIQIISDKDFGHDQFQRVMTRQMLAASLLPKQVKGAYYLVTETINIEGTSKIVTRIKRAANNDSNAPGEVIIPNPPYTPSLKSITLNYKSTSTSDTDGANNDLQLIHLHPFENTYQVFDSPKGKSLIPQYEEKGALLIGLENLQAEQSLSLLFQLSENTAGAEAETATLQWYYLKDNNWEAFEQAAIPSDTTEALIRSGIVQLAIPNDINKNNTILPDHSHWIKVAVIAGSPQAVSRTIAIHTQAARVTFQDNENAKDHLATALPPKQISKLELGDAAIKKIEQAYPSFGGRTAESDTHFYIRISERLRHKGRAITLYDYERLVLEAFPDLYKVKCVNHATKDFILQPGEVLVAVIPDFKNLAAVDRLAPKVTKSKLQAIQAFLEDKNTAFVGNEQHSLHVLNPSYDKVGVNFKVQFKPYVTAKGFHEQKLKEAIQAFLAPWAFSSSAEINFGGTIHKSSILNFVEEQDYVDHVVDFKMNRENVNGDINLLEAKSPISIFIPSEFIKVSSKDFECPPQNTIEEKGLGYIKLEALKLQTEPQTSA